MEELFYEIFSDLPRQGPGSKDSTIKAANLIKQLPNDPEILDVGCGTGTQTIDLFNHIGGKITAVDNHQPFLDMLSEKAENLGLKENIKCLNADMRKPGFIDKQFDLIWAEGSIFIIGFEKGVASFKQYLKPNGYVAITEACWLKPDPPDELKEFWKAEYPAITTIQNNLAIIDSLDYNLVDHFALPHTVWLDDFYNPLEQRLIMLRNKYLENSHAVELIDHIQHEIDIYHKYYKYYGYVFYIIQKSM